MDLHGYPQAENGRFEQILNQFLLKSLHIILDSRVPANRPHSRGGEVKKSDKWFNLVLGERPSAMDSLSFWNRSSMEPMIIDIILVQEPQNSSLDMFIETVVERWVVQYEYQRPMAPQNIDASYKKTYKKSIILLRSVFSMLRLLPAYKAFQKVRSLKQNCDFEISYKISSFGAPFSRTEEESMKKYSFAPIEAQQGCLSISVVYREDLSDFNLDAIISCPPEIIIDYVGSPLTDPMRAFSSTSSDKGRPTSFPIRGRHQSPSPSPPSSSPFHRPHSWSSGAHQGFSSSSPTEIQQHMNKHQYQRAPPYHRTFSDDLVSPPFSPSPSPSPPTYFSGGNNRLTAPVSIPHPMMGRSPKYLSPNLSDPNRNSLPPLSPRNTKYDPSSHESSSGSRLRSGESSSGPINVGQKVSRDGKEDSGRFSSLLSSSSSPRVGFSRSSSRLSFQDDDFDFSCPFIVDDVDPPDSQSSQNIEGRNSSEISSQTFSTIKKSHDAAVGALVHMLKTAPHLRHDSSYSPPQASKIELEGELGAASGFFKPRRTIEALEDFKGFKDFLLLSKSVRVTGKGIIGT